MAKPLPTEFQYKKSKPYHGKEYRVWGYVDGVCKLKWFSTEKEAKAEVAERNCERAAYGSKLNLDLAPSVRFRYANAEELLAPYGGDILEAVRFFIKDKERACASVLFSELATKIRAETERRVTGDEIGTSHAKNFMSGLRKLESKFGPRLVKDITTNEVREWLNGLPLSARSKTNNVKTGRQVFTIAVDHGYTNVNPFKAVKPYQARVSEANSKIHTLTAAETARLLYAADTKVVPFLAVAFFTGIRRATLERLDWADIRFDEKRIIVPGYKGKNQQRYDVTLSENALAWLAPYVRATGSLLVSNRKGKADDGLTRKLILKAATKAGVVIPKNAARHTFISMHIAQHGNADKTALEANNSVSIIKQTYRDVVKHKDAAKYWSITPANSQNVE